MRPLFLYSENAGIKGTRSVCNMHNIKNFNFNDHCRKLKVHIVGYILP